MNEDIRRFFSWQSYKLVLLDFGIINIRTSLNSFELSIITKEPIGEKNLSYTWKPKELEKFYQEIREFNGQVAKTKGFRDKMIVFNRGERKMQTSLYFKKDQWDKFFNMIQEAYKNYEGQRKIFAGF
ncbi:hypothetical protein ES702_01373 [subsurface metagenome]